MNSQCRSCNAIHFAQEATSRNVFSKCCSAGDVVLDNLGDYPQLLFDLLTGRHGSSRNFMEHIRSYNSALSFASIGANLQLPPGAGPYCFRINGQMYHRISHIDDGSARRRYGQLYFVDTEEATDARADANVNCIRDLLDRLDRLFRDVNPFARAYRTMREVETEERLRAQAQGRMPVSVMLQIVKDRKDVRRYNLPTVSEVAVVFKATECGSVPLERDIRIHLRGGNHQTINIDNPNCDPLSYALLFPRGEQGWCENMVSVNRNARNRKRVKISMMDFYQYRLQVRPGTFNPILNAGKLTQQYIVDAYVKMEAINLRFIQRNQSNLRVERYQGLIDHLQNEMVENDVRLGRMVILPSSFTGSPRAMRQLYMDGMAMVTKFGKPDLFVTFTCNPKWNEIVENLEPHQQSHFRPDLVARVFHLKLEELLADLTDRHVLGEPVSWMYTVEFQKRGLPHAHILITLRDEDKPRTPDEFDSIVCAELPDEETEPRLFEIVTTCMIHGPCGRNKPHAVCMVNGKCSKQYPKSFCEETTTNVNGYPVYRRRDDGRTANVRRVDVDNRDVVPYNKWLSLKYNTHVNVEICSSAKSVKYIYKYIHKGYDCASVQIESRADDLIHHDEIKSYLDSRYVSSPEAAWRLFAMKMHAQSHSVFRLAVHLPYQQDVYFHDDQVENAVLRAAEKDTTLTAWFKLNQNDATAVDLLYCEIPTHYVFKQNVWTARKRGAGKILPRMFSVSLKDQEKYCLRLLLLHVRGARCFEDVRTVDGVVYETFKEAALARNLLTDDAEWRRCLEEAVIVQMPVQLRDMFAYMCACCDVSEPNRLWEEFKEHFCEDYSRRHERPIAEAMALADIETVLMRHGTDCRQVGLPVPDPDFAHVEGYVFDWNDEYLQGLELRGQLNDEQSAAFETIMAAFNDDDEERRYFFLDGPGGSGKTFLYNTLLCVVRGMRQDAVPVAWTGIAAMLLKGGRTAHSTFKLPVPIVETSTCNLKRGQFGAEFIKRSKLIIWDEVTMTPGLALDVVDRSLRDIMQNDKPFGGKVVLLGGDFRQCLPVVLHGNRVTIVEACVKNSAVWPLFRTLRLTANMRARAEEREFCEFLKLLGEGRLKNEDGLPDDCVPIPNECVTEDVVGDLFGNRLSRDEVVERAILSPKNEDCLRINEKILERFPGETRIYTSVDSIDDPEDAGVNRDDYSMEFLNSLTPSGMPPHRLLLKQGCVVMLLRNLDVRKGLCNGTRLIVSNLNNFYLDAEIAVGSFKGNRVFIPRIDLAPSNPELPFVLRRRQYPIRLAYSITINKAQGQTLEKVGVFLPKPVFSHGQLYVAFSRARSMGSVRVQITDSREQGKLKAKKKTRYTRNVVYSEVL